MNETPTDGTVHPFPVPLTQFDLLEDKLTTIRDAFFATKPLTTGGKPIFAVRYDFYIDREDHNYVVQDIQPNFYSLDDQGADQCVMNFLPPLSRQAGMALHFDMSITSGLSTSVGYLVSSLPSEQREPMGGRHVSLYIMQDIIVFMQEYIPSWLESRYNQLFLDNGPVDKDAEARALCQIILPPFESGHANLKSEQLLDKSWDMFVALFADRADEFADEIKPVRQSILNARPIS